MLHWLVGVFAQNAVLGIFLSLFVGSALFPLPTEILLPLTGIVVKEGALRFWPAVAIAVLAQMLGSAVSYFIGRHGGRSVVSRYGKYVLLGQREMAWVDRWFASYGELAVAGTRLLGLRVPISIVAGVACMPFFRFFIYTLFGILPWTVLFVWLGYEAGRIWEHPAWKPFWRITWTVVAMAAATLWVVMAIRRKSQAE